MRRQHFLSTLILLYICSFLLSSCGNETTLGADIIDEEDLNVLYAEDFDLVVEINEVDSIITYSASDFVKRIFLLGKLDDPIFGKSSASVVTQIYISGSSPEFEKSDILDSMVFSLKLDTLGIYGNNAEPVDIEIRRVLDDFVISNNYYSNTEVATGNTVIASATRRLAFDSISIFEPPLDSNVVSAPQIRLPLNMDLANQIFEDPTLTESDSVFTEFFKGIKIDVVSESNSMGSIDMGTSRGFSTDNESLLQVYYSRDTSKFIYNFVLGGVRFNQFEQDYTQSLVSDYLAKETELQELILLQTRSGIETDLNIEHISSLGNVLLNNVELEFTAEILNIDDDNLYPPLTDLIAYQDNASGGRLFITDLVPAITNASLQPTLVEQVFGGVLLEEEVSGVKLNRYRMNVTKFAQDYLKGENDGIITLSSYNAVERAGRSVIHGPESNSYPVKLKVTYTIR